MNALRYALLTALCLLPACAALDADLPNEFLQLETEPYEIRALTADDAQLRAREFESSDGGDLDFWSEALHHELVEVRGYAPEGDPVEVVDGDGQRGIARTYRTIAEGFEVGFLVALFVREESDRCSRIRVAEFAAENERFDELKPQVLDSLRTLRR